MVVRRTIRDREWDKFKRNPALDTAARTDDVQTHGILTAQLQLTADIHNGVDISIYMVNDNGEILHNLNGQFLTEV